MGNYLDKLRESARATGSIACMGLDPVVDTMPEKFRKSGIMGASSYFGEIFEEMKKQRVLPGAFKPNHGFYEVHDKPRDLILKLEQEREN